MATAASGVVKPFSSAHSFARITIIFMIVLVPIFAASALTDAMEIKLLNALNDEELSLAISMEEIEFIDFWFLALSYLQLLWYPALVFFLIWFYKVYRNLPSLGGEGLQFSPGWAIAYFFIPIVSFWKPFQATTEIWKVSDPTVMTSNRQNRREIRVSAVVLAWWIFWVLSNMTGWYSLRQSFSAEESIESYIRMDWIYLVSDILTGMSVALTVPVVREINKRQSKKVQVINSLSGNITPDIAVVADRKAPEEDGQDFQGLKPQE